MKRLGRKHRPFFRICAVDSHAQRDGRVIEELGTYDPMVSDTDARVLLAADRVQYWLSVGALPSGKVRTLIKKYGSQGTHLEAQRVAREKLAMPKVIPPPPEPVYVPSPKALTVEEAAAPEAGGPAEPAPAGDSPDAPA
jgi:small subunit ribosomal protein S16